MHDGKEEKNPSHCFLSHDIYQCDKVWISLQHHHYHLCICKKWRCCNFHDHVDIIPPSDSSSRWTKNVWQAEKCSIRSRKEKKRHNPFQNNQRWHVSILKSKHISSALTLPANIDIYLFWLLVILETTSSQSSLGEKKSVWLQPRQEQESKKQKKWQSLIGNILTDIFLFPMVPNKKPIWR